jgi:hypothetical protein
MPILQRDREASRKPAAARKLGARMVRESALRARQALLTRCECGF